ncbi:MAG: hypothetical protein WCC21_04385 [Candidatus Acidiferrales bacterium]
MRTFQLNSRLQRGDTEVLVICCGDYRFQGAFYEFLNQGLNLNEKYDLMVIPGGPLSLTLVEYLPKYSWASWKWFRFFVEKHGIRRLILIQHQDCAWYKAMPLHLHASAEPRERQEQDLGRVTATLKRDFPDLTVELYYAGWDADDRITIDTIPA